MAVSDYGGLSGIERNGPEAVDITVAVMIDPA
jgi:hypothetical protein